MSAQLHLKISGFNSSVSPCVANGWGYLTPEVIISLWYYFFDDWATVGMCFSVCAVFEKKQKFQPNIYGYIIINEIVLLPWQLFCMF